MHTMDWVLVSVLVWQEIEYPKWRVSLIRNSYGNFNTEVTKPTGCDSNQLSTKRDPIQFNCDQPLRSTVEKKSIRLGSILDFYRYSHSKQTVLITI